MGPSGPYSLPALSARPSSPTCLPTPTKCLKRPVGKQGHDRASHCFCPQQAPGHNARHNQDRRHHDNQSPASGQVPGRETWAADPGEWEWVFRGDWVLYPLEFGIATDDEPSSQVATSHVCIRGSCLSWLGAESSVSREAQGGGGGPSLACQSSQCCSSAASGSSGQHRGETFGSTPHSQAGQPTELASTSDDFGPPWSSL